MFQGMFLFTRLCIYKSISFRDFITCVVQYCRKVLEFQLAGK